MSQSFTTLLFLKSSQLEAVTDHLDQLEVLWVHEDHGRDGQPPMRMLECFGSELMCLKLSAKHDLVEELLSCLRREIPGNLLETLAEQLSYRGFKCTLAIGLSSGHGHWVECSTASGNFEKLDLFFYSLRGDAEHFPDFGILVHSRVDDPSFVHRLPEEPTKRYRCD